jgi:uncharacterized membrane protein (DUF373 family)
MPSDESPGTVILRPASRVLDIAENAVYVFVGALLVVGALAVLVSVGYHLVDDVTSGAEKAITAALDGLLLVFILLELLAAVRAVMTERHLVAEPFLIAGVVASIKEILVLTLKAEAGKGDAFDDSMIEIGVLGALSSPSPSPGTSSGARSGIPKKGSDGAPRPVGGRSAADPPRSALPGGGVDHHAHLGHAVGRETPAADVLGDELLVDRVVHAIDLVTGHVAVDPLDVRTEVPQSDTEDRKSVV